MRGNGGGTRKEDVARQESIVESMVMSIVSTAAALESSLSGSSRLGNGYQLADQLRSVSETLARVSNILTEEEEGYVGPDERLLNSVSGIVDDDDFIPLPLPRARASKTADEASTIITEDEEEKENDDVSVGSRWKSWRQKRRRSSWSSTRLKSQKEKELDDDDKRLAVYEQQEKLVSHTEEEEEDSLEDPTASLPRPIIGSPNALAAASVAVHKLEHLVALSPAPSPRNSISVLEQGLPHENNDNNENCAPRFNTEDENKVRHLANETSSGDMKEPERSTSPWSWSTQYHGAHVHEAVPSVVALSKRRKGHPASLQPQESSAPKRRASEVVRNYKTDTSFALSSKTSSFIGAESSNHQDHEHEHHEHYIRCTMINPHSTWRVCWDLGIALAVMYLVVLIPYQLGFEPHIFDGEKIFEWCLDAFFISDLILNFRTGYIDSRGRVIMDPKKCAWHYLREWFIVDLVSSIPPFVDLINLLTRGTSAHTGTEATSGTRLLRIGRLLRGFKLVRIVKVVYSGMHQSSTRDIIDDILAAWTTKFIQKLLSMTLAAFMLAHLLACFFALSGLAPLKNYEPFQARAAINWPIRRQYVAMMYWAWSTMTTVGFGDVVAESHNNRVYAIIAMFIGSAFYSYVIAMAASIVGSRDAKQATYFQRMDQLNAWMAHHHFPSKLQRHIRRYFRYRFARRTALNERLIMDELEPHLQELVANELLPDAVRTNELFEALPRATLLKLIPIISEITIHAGSIIVERGKRTSSFFILTKGEAELFDPLEEGALVLQPGDSFGELALLGVRSTSQVTVTAQTEVVLLVMQRDKFVDAFRALPEHLNRMQARCALRAIERLQQYHQRSQLSVSSKTARSIALLRALALKDVFHIDDHHAPSTDFRQAMRTIDKTPAKSQSFTSNESRYDDAMLSSDNDTAASQTRQRRVPPLVRTLTCQSEDLASNLPLHAGHSQTSLHKSLRLDENNPGSLSNIDDLSRPPSSPSDPRK